MSQPMIFGRIASKVLTLELMEVVIFAISVLWLELNSGGVKQFSSVLWVGCLF